MTQIPGGSGPRRTRWTGLLLPVALALPFASLWTGRAEGAAPGAGHARRICRARLVSELEPEMTTVDSILEKIVRRGMSDEEKCTAVMKYVNGHVFWGPSDRGTDHGIGDPIVLLNCYTATICQQDAAVLTAALWSALGYDVRYWQLGGHTTGEVLYGGKWRNFDATFDRILRNRDGSVAGVKERPHRMYKPEKSRVSP